MKLEWSVFAMAERDEIFDFIEVDSPQAADAVDERIYKQVQTLKQFPNSGRPGRVEGTREWVISGTPYILVYRVTNHIVRILRVLHSAQLWPDDIPTCDDDIEPVH